MSLQELLLGALGFTLLGAAMAVAVTLWVVRRDPRPAAFAALPEPPLPVEAATLTGVAPETGAESGPAQAMTDLAEDTIAVDDAIDPAVFPVFEEEVRELLQRLELDLRRWMENTDDPAPRAAMLGVLQMFKGSARVAGAMQLGECAQRMEAAIESISRGAVTRADFQKVVARFDTLQTTFDSLRGPEADDATAPVPKAAALDALSSELEALAAAAKPPLVPTLPAASLPSATLDPAPATPAEVVPRAAFTLVLPQTTESMQVVMLRAGLCTLGVASHLVEAVHQVASTELDLAYRHRSYPVGEENIPFYWAGALLQAAAHGERTPAPHNTVVIVRSGAQRVALHADTVLGNQDVTVENLGPQLSRLPGLSAVSVLASGSVALIYSPTAPAADTDPQAEARVPHGAPAPSRAPTVNGGAITPAATAPAAAPVIPLILVVDDSITVRAVAQRLLQREGFRVALAVDGMQALSRLSEERPAVLLSDVEMPRMDGFDLARNVRADGALAGLPIIMITSRIAEKHREHARQLGVNHYLGKPYSEEELIRLVRLYTGVMAPAATAAVPAAA